jgi:flavin-dependent dehydrogenase
VTRCDALIVGGGPAGSTCAGLLRRAGWDVVVADSAHFPRDKVCAGWLTLPVFPLLGIDPAEYRAAGLTLQELTAFKTGVFGRLLLETRYPRVISYAIRRCEFDDFLLRRAGVRVLEGTRISALRRTGSGWLANESIEAPVVIGAGGHFCPVARYMRGSRAAVQPIVAREAEIRFDGHGRFSADAAELFFCEDLNGYAWLVPKGPYVNVGIGRGGNRAFGEHLARFMAFLETTGKLPRASRLRWRGHAYAAAGVGATPLIEDGLLLVGDAAGLAYPESGEGIRPAIESARLAAQALIDARGRHGLDDLGPYEAEIQRRHPPPRRHAAPVQTVRTAVGRALLGSRALTRHVVLDRWFLRV